MKEPLAKICTIRKKSSPGVSLLQNDHANRNLEEEDNFELALPKASLWKPGTEIKIAFLSGTNKIRDRVKEYASEWLQYANLHFEYVKKRSQADIRITFNKKYGSWSGVGKDNLKFDPSEPTMNFGWLDDETTEEDFRSVVLHEYGHMIGCGHEHESPKNGGVPWDKEKAYKYYMRTQGWTKEEIDAQIFDTYKNNQIRGTQLDKDSIMMYAIPESITIGNFRVGWNTELSPGDKEFIGKVYPFNK